MCKGPIETHRSTTMYNKCSYPRFILHPHFLIRVLSSIRIFSSAFYPPSAFSYPRFILHPHFLIRVLSSIRIFSSVFSHPPSVSAIRIRHPHPYPRFIPTQIRTLIFRVLFFCRKQLHIRKFVPYMEKDVETDFKKC